MISADSLYRGWLPSLALNFVSNTREIYYNDWIHPCPKLQPEPKIKEVGWSSTHIPNDELSGLNIKDSPIAQGEYKLGSGS